MRLMSPFRYLRQVSLTQKFCILIGLVTVIFILELASFWFALSITSDIRSYVSGESLWSKAQKESYGALLRYSTTFSEADYQHFRDALAVTTGDRQARLELEKADPDFAVVREGFLQGGNHPDDIEGMIFLFRTFRDNEYMAEAVTLWASADELVQNQVSIGEQMRERLVAYGYNSQAYNAIRPLVAEATANDAEITRLSKRFSATLAEGSREFTKVLFYAIFALTLVLGVIALTVALFILRMLTQVDRAKTEFVALTSHQLRSPLSVMTLSIDLLKQLGGTHTKEEEEIVGNIAHEVHAMGSLVDTILNLSRIELGTLTVNPERMDLIACVKEHLHTVAIKAEQKEITLKESFSHPVIPVDLDPVLFRMIVQNLVANAIQYTPQGGVVTVSAEKREGEVLLGVADTGHGIPLEDQPNVFRKLFRASNAAKHVPHGTGLGLYIVKSIVNAVGGRIWFESEEGRGTTFGVAFPSAGMTSPAPRTHLLL